MVELNSENSEANGITRTHTDEYERPFDALQRLKTLDDEQFAAQWVDIYFKEYLKADSFREVGDHKNALAGFKRSRQIIHLAREKGSDEEWILVREATLHYMIIQCYSNLQKDPDVVMREFHNFGVVLNDFVELVFRGRPEMQDHLDELRQIHIDENYIRIEILLDKLVIFDETQIGLNVKELEKLWLCAYFFTRFTNSIHDFFLKSTSLINVARKYHGICKIASRVARSAYNRIPNDYIEANPSLVPYKELMKWLDGFDDFLIKELGIELGEEEGSTAEDSRSTVEINALLLNASQIDKDNPVDRRGYEFALEIGVQHVFDSIVKDESNYLLGIVDLSEKAQQAMKNGFNRVAIKSYIYICRAALQYDSVNDAKIALKRLHDLKQTKADDISQEAHIFDRWVLVLEAEVKLFEYNVERDIGEVTNEQRGRARDTLELVKIKDKHPLKQLEQIEKIFALYKLDNDSKPPNLSYKALDAKIYYLLGLVALEKIKILGAQYTIFEDKEMDFDKGKELLQAFIDAVRYLSEAHTVLDDMQFKGISLKDKIAQTYEEVLSLNYEIFGTQKRDQKDNEKKKPAKKITIDMKEVARDYHVQKITCMLYTALLNDNDDFELALNDILQTNFPTISNVSIVEENTGNEQHQQAIANFKKGKRISYFYHLPDGTITEVVPLDEEAERYLVIEMDIKLTKNAKEVIVEMTPGINQFLKIRDLRPKLDELCDKNDGQSEDEYIEVKNQVLELFDQLTTSLLRRHKPTLRHCAALGEMMEQNALDLSELGYEVDPQIAFIAGRAHDIGKIFLNNQMQLDIARRFQNFERDEVQKHIINALVFILKIIGFKHFKELTCVIGAHHVKYGFDKGYPFVAQGDNIKFIPQQINMVLGLKPGDKNYMEGELDPCYCVLARMIPLDDMMQALRSKERLYRDGPRPIDDLISSVISRAGSEFDPDAVILRIQQLRAGKFNRVLAQSPEDEEYLANVEGPEKAFKWSEIWTFVNFNQGELEGLCGIQFDTFKGELMQGMSSNSKMTLETLGRGICGIMIDEEGRDAGKAHYLKIQEQLFSTFNTWTLAHNMTT